MPFMKDMGVNPYYNNMSPNMDPKTMRKTSRGSEYLKSSKSPISGGFGSLSFSSLLSSFFTSAPFALPEKSKIKCLSI
jgi:hypothetical protein